jgi:tetratricopeptide (TPR) repeat protein
VIEERLVEGSGAHFLFTCLEHQASEVRQLVLEAFELPAQYLEIDDPLEPTCEPLPLEHQRNPVLNFHNDQFRAARYDHVLAEVNRLIFTDPESTDLYVLRIHYHMQHEKYDKALSDLTSLSELDSEHVLFNSMQLFRELFAKLSEDQLAKLRTLSSTRVKKLSELAQQYCEENSVGTGLGPADSKPRDSDWESISTDSSEQNTPQVLV